MSAPNETAIEKVLLTTNRAITLQFSQPKGRVVVFDPVSKDFFDAQEPAILDALCKFALPRSKSEVVLLLSARWGLSESDARALVESLVDSGLVIAATDPPPRIEEARREWEIFGWSEAFTLYSATRDYPLRDYMQDGALEADHAQMAGYSAEAPPPPNTKSYPGTRAIQLPAPDALDGVTVRQAWAGRQEVAHPQLDARLLSTFLYFVFGKTGSIRFNQQGEFIRKTSPSGGARNPIEAYVLAFPGQGIPAGLYHYSVEPHELRELAAGDFSADVRDIVWDLDSEAGFRHPAAIVFMSLVYERPMWRYRDDSRSYRPMIHDLGHTSETFGLVAKGLSLRSRVDHGFKDNELNAFLGLDGVRESVYLYGALGV